jgi:hypothetical protein
VVLILFYYYLFIFYFCWSLCGKGDNSIWVGRFAWFMVFNTNFNNISVISWRSVLLVEETGVPGVNHRPVASHWQTSSHNVVSNWVQTHNFGGDRFWWHRYTTLVVIGFDGTGTCSCNANYHTITATTAPQYMGYAGQWNIYYMTDHYIDYQCFNWYWETSL